MTPTAIILAFAFILLAPVIGCLLQGADRIVTARMQGRMGPSILQPYYDVRKLLDKDSSSIEPTLLVLLVMSLLAVIAGGAAFFAGGSFLLCVFLITLGSLLFILAAYVSGGAYAQIGAQREILQVMCYEPMVLFVAVGVYLHCGSFDTSVLTTRSVAMAAWQPLIFLGFCFILTIKLRKSPFDIAMSHHAHQEIVRGATTEMCGKALALVEVTHWYENVLFLAWTGMFFITANPFSIVAALIVVALIWLIEIWVDNNFARVKWQVMLKSSWLVALIAAFVNFSFFYFVGGGVALLL